MPPSTRKKPSARLRVKVMPDPRPRSMKDTSIFTRQEWESISWAIRHLGFRRRRRSLYEITNPNGIWGIPDGIRTQTVTEGKSIARKALIRRRLIMKLESQFVRLELMRGLKPSPFQIQEWLLSRRDCERFLHRVQRRKYPVHWIEAFRPKGVGKMLAWEWE